MKKEKKEQTKEVPMFFLANLFPKERKIIFEQFFKLRWIVQF